ncbi:2-oxo-4-hydroxy-4-carboxy-5-ureidoimidazoline decarboxylase [Nocardia caishijiensis]|uniref:2-oxo-4-hydroxy-4-carboxy-5-ureidoimidazoline decarboxylase n=2 Tax=Nocardia caishijiensis TaxID=184756 RepID=A0ABQ6YUB0_9NOCA|nr:2-oxo-4-hydroxy-4-carboxy-5-ureidoimidazoline decarboxylase [Nocardia caishijiensis]
MGLAEFNALPDDAAEQLLLACCSSPRWAAALAAARPYVTVVSLLDAADAAADALDEVEIDAALAGHPRIGERATGTAAHEQAGVTGDDVRARLAEGNRTYEEKFGHIYLVCAAGRDGEELLAVLQSRLDNDVTTERQVMRNELAKINRLRLTQLVAS